MEGKQSKFGGFLDGFQQGNLAAHRDLIMKNVIGSKGVLEGLLRQIEVGADFHAKDEATELLHACMMALSKVDMAPMEGLLRYGELLRNTIHVIGSSNHPERDQLKGSLGRAVFHFIDIVRAIEEPQLMDTAILLDEALGQ